MQIEVIRMKMNFKEIFSFNFYQILKAIVLPNHNIAVLGIS